MSRLTAALVHARMRHRIRPTLILATDGDIPGRRSAFSTALQLGPGFDVRIADLPPGKDPEDLDIRQLRPLLQQAASYVTYLNRQDEVGQTANDVLERHYNRRFA